MATLNNLPTGEYEELPHHIQLKILGPELFKKLQENNWALVRYGQHDEGSCFFHSLAEILDYQAKFTNASRLKSVQSGRDLRQAIMNSVTTSEDYYSFWEGKGLKKSEVPSPDVLREKLSNISVWAELFMCVWAFHRANINLIFYDMEAQGAPYCGVSVDTQKCKKCVDNWDDVHKIPNGRGRLAMIAWIRHSHFEPIFLHCKTDCKSVQEELVHRRNDGLWVLNMAGEIQKAILDEYQNGSCSRLDFTTVARNQSFSLSQKTELQLSAGLHNSKTAPLPRPARPLDALAVTIASTGRTRARRRNKRGGATLQSNIVSRLA
jgi:hypothetical protein